MSAAKVNGAKVTPLDGKATSTEVATEANVQEPAKLARFLGTLLADVAALKRRFAPSRIDYENLPALAASNVVSVEHKFGGAVRYWQVGGNVWVILAENAATTPNTLVLDVTGAVDGTFALRVEEAG